MTAELIDGKALAAALRARVAAETARLNAAHGLTPGLTVVIAGDDPASHIYVRNKAKAARECGFKSAEFQLGDDVGEAELLAQVAGLNDDPEVHGILVQLPLPAAIDELAVIDAIDPAKDVDGFHVINSGRLFVGMDGIVPCTPLGCLMMLRSRFGADGMSGLNAVVVGRSNIVGKPVAQLLLREHCTVTMAHSRTRDLAALCRTADILVAAVGRAEMIRGAWIKPGATVIDVGMNRLAKDGGGTRLAGDVCFAEAVEVAAAITPVPGGVGPMTIAVLMANTLTAACGQAGLPPPALD